MNDLMTLDEIAQMHRCSIRHARDVIVKLPDFPPEAPESMPLRRRWRRQEVINFIHRRPIDAPGAFHLYRHFSAQGELLYVGVSLSTVARLGQHQRNAHWFDRIARIEVERFATREASVAAEKAAIQSEHPLYNTQHARQACATATS